LPRSGSDCRFDDFGTGYSTLGYLSAADPVAEIDQSFVEGIPDDADSRAIVHAMLAVARHFRLKVVAEGIETAEQASICARSDASSHRDYFYSRPLSAATILEYLDQAQPSRSKSAQQWR